MEHTHALETFAKGLAGTVEPVIRLAIEAVTPLLPVTAVLRATQERYPTTRIELSTERLTGAAEALGSGRVDLAIATRMGMHMGGVEAARFGTVRILAVAHRDHPLSNAGSPTPPGLLRAHAQIVLRDSAQASDAPSLNVLDGGLRWSVTEVGAKLDLIRAGMGWGGLPAHVVEAAVADGELVVLDVPEFDADRMELFVLRRRDRANGVVASTLWDALRTVGLGARRRPRQSLRAGPGTRSAPRR
jgi:DNA-binding transcriptional LysR family regulator